MRESALTHYGIVLVQYFVDYYLLYVDRIRSVACLTHQELLSIIVISEKDVLLLIVFYEIK